MHQPRRGWREWLLSGRRWEAGGTVVGTEGGGRQPRDWHRLAGCGAVKISKFFCWDKIPRNSKNTFWELPIRFASQNDRNGEGYPNILSNYLSSFSQVVCLSVSLFCFILTFLRGVIPLLCFPSWAPEPLSEMFRKPPNQTQTHPNCFKARWSTRNKASQRLALAWWEWWWDFYDEKNNDDDDDDDDKKMMMTGPGLFCGLGWDIKLCQIETGGAASLASYTVSQWYGLKK